MIRVLGIGAHPDDLEILAGGTLARYVEKGHEIVMGVVTDGSAGSKEHPTEELRKIRRREAEKTANMLKAELIWLGEADELVFDNEKTRLKLVDLIRQARPDLILTHDPFDYHPDHEIVSRAVFRASFVSTLQNIKSQEPPHDKLTPIYYFDTLAGLNFRPNEFVDITDVLEIKLKMMSNHESQVKWLKDHDKIDIFDFIETVAKFRGLQCGVRFAEAFRHVNAWGRLSTKRLLP